MSVNQPFHVCNQSDLPPVEETQKGRRLVICDRANWVCLVLRVPFLESCLRGNQGKTHLRGFRVNCETNPTGQKEKLRSELQQLGNRGIGSPATTVLSYFSTPSNHFTTSCPSSHWALQNARLASIMYIWLWVRNRNPKWNPGAWKHGLEPVVPGGSILTHAHIIIFSPSDSQYVVQPFRGAMEGFGYVVFFWNPAVGRFERNAG